MKTNRILLLFIIIGTIIFTTDRLVFSQTEVRMNLDEIIKSAIENNQGVRSSKLSIEKENAIKQKSFNIPKPELFVEYEGVQGSLSNADSRKIGFIQQFEFPTNYFLRADVGESQIRIAQEELSGTLNALKTNIKLNYSGLLLKTELLKASKENHKIYEDFLFTADKKYEAGESSNLEVLGARVNKIKFENEIKNIESEIRSLQSEIRNLMNVDYYILPTEDLTYKELSLNKAELVKYASENNPGLKVIKYQKEKFSNKVSLSKGELLPDISFKYFRQKLLGNNNYWGMEIGLGVPLWFWGEQSGSIKESDYDLQIASGEEISLRKSIENEISISFEDYENSRRQVKFFSGESLKEVNEILRQSKISYEEGAIGYVEYLQALNLAFETKVQYLNSIFNYNKAIINLENLTTENLK